MNIQKSFLLALEKYADDVVVNINGVFTNTKAFIQPVRYTNKMYLDHNLSQMGIKDNSCFLYIGPVVPDITQDFDNVILYSDGRSFAVKRADKMKFKKEGLYIRAVLTLRISEGEYEYI